MQYKKQPISRFTAMLISKEVFSALGVIIPNNDILVYQNFGDEYPIGFAQCYLNNEGVFAQIALYDLLHSKFEGLFAAASLLQFSSDKIVLSKSIYIDSISFAANHSDKFVLPISSPQNN